MRNGLSEVLLALAFVAATAKAAPFPVPAPASTPTPQDIRSASRFQVERDGEWVSTDPVSRNEHDRKSATRRNWFGTASIEELTAYLHKLQERDRHWRDMIAARERRKEQRGAFERADKETQEAMRTLLETEQDLQNALVRQAVSAARFVLPADSGASRSSHQNPASGQSEIPVIDGEPYVDYVIDMPAAIINKGKRRVKVKARRGVMELHQQLQDLNQVLINDVTRMTGSPLR